MDKRYLFINNPIAGGAKNDFTEIFKAFKAIFPMHKIVDTTHVGHAKEVANTYKNDFDVIVAVGGDGTINEVAAALVNTGIPMGIIPQGSGNGFANHLKISHSTNQALQQLAKGSPKKIDTVVLNNNQLFVNVAGVGFDGHIANLFVNSKKRGFWSYAKLVITEFIAYKEFEYSLKSNENIIRDSAFIIAFANASQYGNNFYVAPSASSNDGLLNAIFLKKPPLWFAPFIAWKMFRGKNIGNKYCNEIIGKEFLLTHQSNSLQLDGEVVECSNTLKLKVIPNSLKVIF